MKVCASALLVLLCAANTSFAQLGFWAPKNSDRFDLTVTGYPEEERALAVQFSTGSYLSLNKRLGYDPDRSALIGASYAESNNLSLAYGFRDSGLEWSFGGIANLESKEDMRGEMQFSYNFHETSATSPYIGIGAWFDENVDSHLPERRESGENSWRNWLPLMYEVGVTRSLGSGGYLVLSASRRNQTRWSTEVVFLSSGVDSEDESDDEYARYDKKYGYARTALTAVWDFNYERFSVSTAVSLVNTDTNESALRPEERWTQSFDLAAEWDNLFGVKAQNIASKNPIIALNINIGKFFLNK